MARVKGKTESGFEYEIDERVRKDMRTLRAIRNFSSKDEDEQLASATDLDQIVLGKKQAEDFENFIADVNDGFMDAQKILHETMEIFKGTTDYSGEESEDAKNL